MTQGDPLFPTIFNVVVDAVVCHWDSLIAGETRGGNRNDDEAGKQTEGRMIWGRDNMRKRAEEGHVRLKVQSAFFYRDERMVASKKTGVSPYYIRHAARVF